LCDVHRNFRGVDDVVGRWSRPPLGTNIIRAEAGWTDLDAGLVSAGVTPVAPGLPEAKAGPTGRRGGSMLADPHQVIGLARQATSPQRNHQLEVDGPTRGEG
jgi:hypothetical protein